MYFYFSGQIYFVDNVYQQRKEVSYRYCEFAVFNQSFKNITDQSFFAFFAKPGKPICFDTCTANFRKAVR